MSSRAKRVSETIAKDAGSGEMNVVQLPGVPEESGHPHPSYAEHKARIQTRLRRLEGQVRGVQRMIEEDTYCVDVLTQLSAIIAASRGVGMLVLEDHIRGCVMGAPESEREDRLDELTEAIERFTRTVGG
jgi:DNA-binding FrmR family transcriptional regulator